MGKIIEFKTPLGQRTLVNTDYIVLVSDTKSNKTRIFVAVQSKNSGVISVSDFVDLMDKGEVRLLQGNFTEPDMKMIAKGVLASTEIARELKALFK